jgi:hypothetical protein
MAILMSRNNPELYFQGVFNSLKGVMFMGTPHRGGWMEYCDDIPAKTLDFEVSINLELVEALQRNNPLLEWVQRDFLAMIRQVRKSGRRLEVTCFFEELPTSGVGLVVSKDSATFDGYMPRSIRADLHSMVKIASVEDNGFKRVLGELVSWTGIIY